MEIVIFICWVAAVALFAAFLLSLASKWGILEWLQIHAPNNFLHELFACGFCCSWWVNVAISLSLLLVLRQWWFAVVPFCSTLITRNIWLR